MTDDAQPPANLAGATVTAYQPADLSRTYTAVTAADGTYAISLPVGAAQSGWTVVAALGGCIAGAVLVADTERFAREAGLMDILLERKPDYVAHMTSFADPLYQKIVAALPAAAKLGDYVTSLDISARKPR